MAGAAGDTGGDVQDPVAECGDLAAAQCGVVGESDEAGPGDQVGGGQHDFPAGGVGSEGVAGQVTQAGGFEFADAVFDAGVLTVAQFQARDLPGHDTSGCVGDERGDPHAVGVGEPQLRTGVGPFFSQDQPGPGRPR